MEKIIEPSKNGRIEYIDAMRGFAMLLVIYGHISLFVFKMGKGTLCFDVLTKFHVPLFFFICGLMSYQAYNLEIKKKVKNRIFGQLLPTIIVCLLYIYYINIPLETMFYDNFKSGYWFTFVLVELFLIYISIAYTFNKIKLPPQKQIIIFFLLIIITYIIKSFLFRIGIFQDNISNLMSLVLVFTNFPYFLFGVIVKMKFHEFKKLFSNNYVISFAIILFVVLFKFDNYGPSEFIQGFLGIIIVFRFFEYYNNIFSYNTKVGRFFIIIGKYTLEIYLLHYFIIKSLVISTEYFNCDIISKSWSIEFIFFSILSSLIAYSCLLIVKFIKISPLLYSLLFGFRK